MDTLESYLERLASAAPIPGGGSGATIVAATGAALVAMVGRIHLTRRDDGRRVLAEELVERADRLRAELLEARIRDEVAFEHVIAAQAMPKGTDAEKRTRRDALEAALAGAAEEPLATAALALETLRLAERLLEIPNRGVVSDVGCAAEFAHAALTACAFNVRINHRFMHDAGLAATQDERLRQLENEGLSFALRVRAAVERELLPEKSA